MIHLCIKGLIGEHEKEQRDQRRPCRYLSEGDDSSDQISWMEATGHVQLCHHVDDGTNRN